LGKEVIGQILHTKGGKMYVCSEDKLIREKIFTNGWMQNTNRYLVVCTRIVGHTFVEGKRVWAGPRTQIPLDTVTNIELKKELLRNYAATVRETSKKSSLIPEMEQHALKTLAELEQVAPQ